MTRLLPCWRRRRVLHINEHPLQMTWWEVFNIPILERVILYRVVTDIDVSVGCWKLVPCYCYWHLTRWIQCTTLLPSLQAFSPERNLDNFSNVEHHEGDCRSTKYLKVKAKYVTDGQVTIQSFIHKTEHFDSLYRQLYILAGIPYFFHTAIFGVRAASLLSLFLPSSLEH